MSTIKQILMGGCLVALTNTGEIWEWRIKLDKDGIPIWNKELNKHEFHWVMIPSIPQDETTDKIAEILS